MSITSDLPIQFCFQSAFHLSLFLRFLQQCIRDSLTELPYPVFDPRQLHRRSGVVRRLHHTEVAREIERLVHV